MSTKKDADALLKMVEEYFVAKPMVRKIPNSFQDSQKYSNNNFFHEQNSIKSYIKKSDNSNIWKDGDVFGKLETIFIYPVKSCAAMEIIGNWKVVSTGLKYDRQWMIVNSSGVCFTQKQERRLCLLKPNINIEEDLLVLSYPGKYFTSKYFRTNFCGM